MGFEQFDKNSFGSFRLINENIKNIAKQKEYYERCMSHYSKISKKQDEKDIIQWIIRLRKSLKEIFTSASFFVEAEECEKEGFLASYYYLNYYSLFHAMLANLVLDPKLDVNTIMDINHTKVVNCFGSNYCKASYPIINKNIEEHFNILKYIREYYSYTMPMNDFFSSLKDIKDLKENLKNNIMQCFQSANFSALCLERSFEKNFKLGMDLKNEDIKYFQDMFKKINGKPHPSNKNLVLLDISDKHARNEFLKYGASIQMFNVDLEHFCDEFRSYNGFNIFDERRLRYDKITSETINLVYSALENMLPSTP